jgi:hypothetical protein
MPIRARVQAIDQDVQLLLDDALGPDAISRQLAEEAHLRINDAIETNRQILGRVPPFKTFVDGKEGALFESVSPKGSISAEFELFGEMFRFIADQLEMHSPVLTGRYQASHAFFADGQQIGFLVNGMQIDFLMSVPPADEYVFVNLVPYARKIERGSSSQAPDGVYQAVANIARSRFGNLARITFGYRTAIGGGIVGGRAGNRPEQRNPAIIVRPNA